MMMDLKKFLHGDLLNRKANCYSAARQRAAFRTGSDRSIVIANHVLILLIVVLRGRRNRVKKGNYE